MLWDEMNDAISEANRTINQADRMIDQMARIMRGKLRSADVDSYTLQIFKRELRDFDMRTSDWK